MKRQVKERKGEKRKKKKENGRVNVVCVYFKGLERPLGALCVPVEVKCLHGLVRISSQYELGIVSKSSIIFLVVIVSSDICHGHLCTVDLMPRVLFHL